MSNKKTTTRTKRRKMTAREEFLFSPNSHITTTMDSAGMENIARIFGIPGHMPNQRMSSYHTNYRASRCEHYDFPMHDDNDYITEDEDGDESQPPITKELAKLMKQVPRPHQNYVYDVYYYGMEMRKDSDLPRLTADTLRIAVISPIIFGIKQQNEEILKWAMTNNLLPLDWDEQQAGQGDLDEKMIMHVEIADTFVQCLLRTEPLNLIKISYHIGEWYQFRKRTAPHTMRKTYELDGLKRDLNSMMLLPSVFVIYADHSKRMIWIIAVFVCHHYFFYLADSEYKKHTLLEDIKRDSQNKTTEKLKEEGNAYHKAGKYSEAIKKYGEGLELSPYSATLYSNRAIAYLKLRASQYASQPDMAHKCAYSAMSDAFRCTKLDPLYTKGHDRYAMALAALDQQEKAVVVLKAAVGYLEKHPFRLKAGDIRGLERRITQYSPPPPPDKPPSQKKANGEKSSESKAVRDKSSDTSPNDISSSKNPQSKTTGDLRNGTKSKIETSSAKSTSDKTMADKSTKQTLANAAASGGRPSTDRGEALPNSLSSGETKQATKKGANEKNNSASKAGSTQKSSEKTSKPVVVTQKPADSKIVTELIKAKDSLNTNLRSGSNAMFEEKYRFAINLYDKCLEMLQEFTAEKLDQTGDQVMILKYARGVAYISVGPNQDIVLGIKELKHLMEAQPSQTMKAITLYELGKAYTRQHRYEEALNPVNESMNICQSKKGMRDVYHWPGTDVFIQHTDPTILKSLLDVLLNQCRSPPLPDFRCSAELKSCVTYGYADASIYVDAPDFRGYVWLTCSEKCRLHYHPECWKKKHVKVNSSCITPDCCGLVFKFTEYDENSQKLHEEKGDRHASKTKKDKKKPLKLPLSNQRRIDRTLEKKLRRKEMRSADKKQANGEGVEEEVVENLADNILSKSENANKPSSPSVSPQPDMRSSTFVIKHKKMEEEAEQQQQVSRKSKKAKSKQTMSLEEFCGPTSYEDAESYSSGSLGIDAANLLRFQHLRDDVARFDMEYQSQTNLPVVIQGINVEQLKTTVSEFYYDLLDSKGPMTADSKEMLEFLEYEVAAKELIQYCGGLAKFLLTTGRFIMIENLICVMKDAKKATDMAEAIRTVPHGIAVVPHDFKANLERASAYVPERKKLSGYAHSDVANINANELAYRQSAWQTAVQDWARVDDYDDDLSQDGRSRGGSLSADGLDTEKLEKQSTTVEKLSPTLLEAWKKAQEQTLIDTLNEKTTMNSLSDEVSPPLSGSRADSDSSGHVGRQASLDSACSDGQLARQTSSIDSSDRITGSVTSDREFRAPRPPSNDSSSSDHSRILTPPNFTGYAELENPAAPSTTDFSPMFAQALPFGPPPPLPYISPAISQSMMPVSIAPIGTPPQRYPNAIGSSVPMQPMMTNHGFGPIDPWNSSNQRMHGAPEWRLVPGASEYGGARSVGRYGYNYFSTAETQTEDCLKLDKQCNTEYEYMDDYDKKVEECNMLHKRNEDLSNKLTQLKQSSAVEIQDLGRQLKDALQVEKETREKSHKIQQTCEKETRRWKDEKRSMNDEVNAMRKTSKETRWKMEEKVSQVKQLEEKISAERLEHTDQTGEKETMIQKYRARLEILEKKSLAAELEVIDTREKVSLYKCNEALDNTNKSIEQQRLQVERLVHNNQPLPTIVRKNAELAASRRQKLMDIRDEQMAIYESQRESIRSGTIPLSSLPKLSPPSLMEIMASTSLPVPRPMPMMHMGPRIPMSPMQGMRPMFPPGQMPLLESPPAAGADAGAGGNAPLSQGSPNRESPTPMTEQALRRNAVEQQLIQDIRGVFPETTEEGVRNYIDRLRHSRQGQGLTGLKLVDLKRQIVELILRDNDGKYPGVTRQDSVSEECPICHDRLASKPVKNLICHHLFHDYCISDWLSRQNTCPVCRTRQP